MRPIERRLAALEARTASKKPANHRLYFIPRDEDEDAFCARCAAEAAEAGATHHFIRFVKPGEVPASGLH